MGSTSNYSWPTPEQTDLVKDGWDAIKDLGDAADTTVKAVSDAQGLVHINTTAFTAVAAQAVNPFSATYKNYLVTIDLSASTGTADLFIKMRSGATDNSAGYYFGWYGYRESAAYVQGAGSNVTTGFKIGESDANGDYYHFNIWFNDPFSASRTTGIYQSANVITDFASITGGFYHNQSTSYDGIDLIASTGNITGTITTYGLKA